MACIADFERKIFGYNSAIKRATDIWHSEVRENKAFEEKWYVGGIFHFQFNFSILFFLTSCTLWQMFDINGKIYASLRQSFSAGSSISIICMFLVKFRFTMTLRRIHGKILPITLFSTLTRSVNLSWVLQGDSWQDTHFWTLDWYSQQRISYAFLFLILFCQWGHPNQHFCTIKEVTKSHTFIINVSPKIWIRIQPFYTPVTFATSTQSSVTTYAFKVVSVNSHLSDVEELVG